MAAQAITECGTYTLSAVGPKTLVQADCITQISIQCTSATSITVTGTISTTTFGASSAISLANGQGVTYTAQPGSYLVGLIIDTSGGGSCIITIGRG